MILKGRKQLPINSIKGLGVDNLGALLCFIIVWLRWLYLREGLDPAELRGAHWGVVRRVREQDTPTSSL